MSGGGDAVAPAAGGASERGPRLPRRRAMRALVAAAGAAAAGRLLAACAPTVAQLTQAAGRQIVLVWRPWDGFSSTNSDTIQSLLYEGLGPFLDAHTGVDVRIDMTPRSSTLAGLAAGSGPDVFHDTVLPTYVQADLVLDITPYVRRDGMDLSIFPAGQMTYFSAASAGPSGGNGLFCLPAAMRVLAIAVNQVQLDNIGLTYPQADWTHEQWAAMWRSATQLDPVHRRYGCLLDWTGYDTFGNNPSPFYLRGFGGEYVDSGDATRCALADAGSLQALHWCYDLVLANVSGGVLDRDFASGALVCGPIGTGGELFTAAAKWQGLKWDLYEMPVWPQGRLTSGSTDFYAISSATKVPDVAWALLRYLCVDPVWQQWMIQLTLAGPNQRPLWDEWRSRVTGFAPPLSRVNLQAFLDPIDRSEVYVGRPFRFSERASADLLDQFGTAVASGRSSVEEAAAVAVQAINQLQAAGASQERQAQQALATLRQLASGSASGKGP